MATLITATAAITLGAASASARALPAPLASPTPTPHADIARHLLDPAGTRPELPRISGAFALPRVGVVGRTPVRADPIEHAIITGTFTAPTAGATIDWPAAANSGRARGGSAGSGGDAQPRPTWSSLPVNDRGEINIPQGTGYVFVEVDSPAEQTLMLEAAGHGMVYVNGQPRAGDPYATGSVRLPVLLRAGANQLLFAGFRGSGTFHPRLTRLPRGANDAPPAFFTGVDFTLPDIHPMNMGQQWVGAVVVNATNQPLSGLRVRAAPGVRPGEPIPSIPGDGPDVAAERRLRLPEVSIGVLAPMTARKVAVPLVLTPAMLNFTTAPADPTVPADANARPAPADNYPIRLQLLPADTAPNADAPLHESDVALRIRRQTTGAPDAAGQPAPDPTFMRTFLSGIDGSVQYYAISPAWQRPDPRGDRPRLPLVLTLHGAAVEATSQIDAHAPRIWANLVAPTNRRPFGFNWEDWGRLDALEVLSNAANSLPTDPSRVYLTGHSMGGHGTWHLGATYPQIFAAAAPSAGWASFWSYAEGKDQRQRSDVPALELMLRAQNPSDSRTLAENFANANTGVYILHGDADDNVPVREARSMRQRLRELGLEPGYHEQPGAGHWWDSSDEPGAECIDWPPIFDLFAARRRPADSELRHIRFITANPAVSAGRAWAQVTAQIQPLEFTRFDLRLDPLLGRLSGTTQNAAGLVLRLAGAVRPGPLTIEIDGDRIELPAPAPGAAERPIVLARTLRPSGSLGDGAAPSAGPWAVSDAPPKPPRPGPFKDAFRNRMIFSYATGGTPEENAWAFAKARYDAETWLVRGNGAVDLVADSDLAGRFEPSRNVIIYGCADTHKAWDQLLGQTPISVRRGSVSIGDQTITGDDLAVMFIRPRADADQDRVASVAVVAGSGTVGKRLTDRQVVFAPGVSYPDFLVLSADMLRDSSAGAAGVRAAGYFAHDWSLERGQWALQPRAAPDAGARKAP